MGFRFRRSFGILPGIRLNVGKRGTSVWLGIRGAQITVGPKGVRNTVGIPGTGMSYTQSRSWRSASVGEQQQPDSSPASSGSADVSRLGWYIATVLCVALVAILISL